MKRTLGILIIAIGLLSTNLNLDATMPTEPNLRMVKALMEVTDAPPIMFERAPQEDVDVPVFFVKFPEGYEGEYDLFSVGLTNRRTEAIRGQVGRDGYFVPSGEATPLSITISSLYPGEPLNFYAVEIRFMKALSGSVVPHPFEKTEDGYTLELKLLDASCSAFLLEVSGLEADEEVDLIQISDGHVKRQAYREIFNGKFLAIVNVATIGKSGGTCCLKIKGKRGGVALTSPWGRQYIETYTEETTKELERAQALNIPTDTGHYESLLTPYANSDQGFRNKAKLSESDLFSPLTSDSHPLQGKIENGRYYAPKSVFSCLAENFGQGRYITQDVLFDRAACVGFYDRVGNFKKAEVIFMPNISNKQLDKEDLRVAFEGFGIGILEDVDNAQGIEILKEETLDGALFIAVSIEKMSVLTDVNGHYISSTRGYLVFQAGDKLVLLSDQQITPYGSRHSPKKHVNRLRKDILNFRKTIEFGPIPTIAIGTDFTLTCPQNSSILN